MNKKGNTFGWILFGLGLAAVVITIFLCLATARTSGLWEMNNFLTSLLNYWFILAIGIVLMVIGAILNGSRMR